MSFTSPTGLLHSLKNNQLVRVITPAESIQSVTRHFIWQKTMYDYVIENRRVVDIKSKIMCNAYGQPDHELYTVYVEAVKDEDKLFDYLREQAIKTLWGETKQFQLFEQARIYYPDWMIEDFIDTGSVMPSRVFKLNDKNIKYDKQVLELDFMVDLDDDDDEDGCSEINRAHNNRYLNDKDLQSLLSLQVNDFLSATLSLIGAFHNTRTKQVDTTDSISCIQISSHLVGTAS